MATSNGAKFRVVSANEIVGFITAGMDESMWLRLDPGSNGFGAKIGTFPPNAATALAPVKNRASLVRSLTTPTKTPSSSLIAPPGPDRNVANVERVPVMPGDPSAFVRAANPSACPSSCSPTDRKSFSLALGRSVSELKGWPKLNLPVPSPAAPVGSTPVVAC